MSRLGLGSVLEETLGVDIPKEKRIQRSDWSNRPLSRKALDYAANDVRYLHELRDMLGKQLGKLGREDWVSEECQRLAKTRYEPSDPEMSVFNVKGWRDLDGPRSCDTQGAGGLPRGPRSQVGTAALPCDTGYGAGFGGP